MHGPRLVQATSDSFLGRDDGAVPCDFYVRQLRGWKGGAAIERMGLSAMSAYGRLCPEQRRLSTWR